MTKSAAWGPDAIMLAVIDERPSWREIVRFLRAPVEHMQRKNSDLSSALHAAGQRSGRLVTSSILGARGGPAVVGYRRIHVTVEMQIETPWFRMWPRSRVDYLGRSPDRYRMDVGTTSFDERVELESPNPQAIIDWLTPTRQAALLELTERSRSWDIERDRLRILILASFNPLTSTHVHTAMGRILDLADTLERP